MTLRYLPPAYSPVSLTGLAAGLAALLLRKNGRQDLQQQIATAYGVAEVLLTDSGTAALGLALRPAGVSSRPVVALPGWGCYDLATASDSADADVLLYDLLPTTLGPDWESLDRVLAQGADTVVVVHPFGLPVDLPEVQRRAARTGARVIEDAAQGVSAMVAGRPAGATGDLGILSFGRGKGLTGGGGGALVRRADGGALPAVSLGPPRGELKQFVALLAQWLLGRPALYGVPASLPFLGLGETRYHAAAAPHAIGIGAAAIVRHALQFREREAENRRQRAAQLRQPVLDAGGQIPALWTGGVPGWLRLPMLPGEALLAAADTTEARRLGVVPSYPLALADLPGFNRVRNREAGFAGSRLLAARLRTLPVHSRLTDQDLQRLTRWLRQASPV